MISNGHERFLELCALATTGELSDRESNELRDHLAHCAECRAALRDYRLVAQRGMALIASESPIEAEPAFDRDAARQVFLGAIAREDTLDQRVPHNLSLFAQDTWQVTPRLVLTYGLRWDYNPSPSVSNGEFPRTVTQVSDLKTMELAPAGTRLWDAQKSNFAPRIGVAYQLGRSNRFLTVLRGGYGLFYDLGYGQIGDVFANNSQYMGSGLQMEMPFRPTRHSRPRRRQRTRIRI